MLQPYFVDTEQGRIFVQSFVPDKPNGRIVLFVPPFAEEMNKSRRMMALLGHALADNGVQMVLPDLFGTGDSEGEFEEANWEIWTENLKNLIKHLVSQGFDVIHLVGLRMGCLLINDVLHQQPQLPIKKVVFWKPVISGKQMVNQFLRLRVANSMMGGNKETTQSLREQLATDGTLEVAGYGLSCALVASLDEKKITAETFNPAIEWQWLEVLTTENQPIALASSKVIQALVEKKFSLGLQSVVGESFWANQEIAEVPDIINKTVSSLVKQ